MGIKTLECLSMSLAVGAKEAGICHKVFTGSRRSLLIGRGYPHRGRRACPKACGVFLYKLSFYVQSCNHSSQKFLMRQSSATEEEVSRIMKSLSEEEKMLTGADGSSCVKNWFPGQRFLLKH